MDITSGCDGLAGPLGQIEAGGAKIRRLLFIHLAFLLAFARFPLAEEGGGALYLLEQKQRVCASFMSGECAYHPAPAGAVRGGVAAASRFRR